MATETTAGRAMAEVGEGNVAGDVLGLFPAGTGLAADGGLVIGGCEATVLAEQYGTPALIVDEAAIRATARRYADGLAARWPNSRVTFASKAFPCTAVYRLVSEEGLGVDVAGGGELTLALAAGADPAGLIVHGNAKTEEELRMAVAAGAGLIVVDNFDDIDRLERILAETPGREQGVLVRVTPDIRPDTHEAISTGQRGSKFGLLLPQAEAAIARLRASEQLRLDGVHVHVGSQILDTRPFAEAVAAVAALGEFAVYDLGGGLGSRYTYSDHPPTIEEYLDAMIDVARELLPADARILIEPGRSMVAEAGVSLYRAVTVKESAGETFVAVDGGMGDNLEVSLYQQRFEATVATRVGGGQPCRLVGRHCESGDTLSTDVPLRDPRPGRPDRRAGDGCLHLRAEQQLQRRAPAPGGHGPRRQVAGGRPPRDLRRPAPPRPALIRLPLPHSTPRSPARRTSRPARPDRLHRERQHPMPPNDVRLRHQLLRRKPVSAFLADADGTGEEGGLRRTVGPFQLTMIGVGATIGTGIFFALNSAVPEAGPAVIISFVIGAVTAALTAFCYAELTSAVPVSGSSYSYAYATLGEFTAWAVGWCLLLEYAVSGSAIAVSWGQYLNNFTQTVFGFQMPAAISNPPGDGGYVNLPGVVLVALCCLLLVRGAKESAVINTVMVLIKLGVLALFVVVGITGFHSSNLHPFAPMGMAGIGAAASSIFFSFIGLDAVSTAGEEVRNPRRTLPIAIISALVVVTAVYILVAVVGVGAQSWTKFQGQEAGLSAILEQVTGASWPGALLSLGAVISIVSVTLVVIYGQTRILYSMGRDGMLPRTFHRVSPRTGTPVASTLYVGAFIALLAAVVPLDDLANLTSMGTLVAFMVVSIGVMVLRRREPDLERGFRVPGYPVVPLLSVGFCGYLIYKLPLNTFLMFAVWLAIALVVYLGYSRHHSRLQLGRPAAPVEETVTV